MMRVTPRIVAMCIVIMVACVTGVSAQEKSGAAAPAAAATPNPDSESAELAKKLSNPLSDVVSVPVIPADGLSDLLASFFFSPKESTADWTVDSSER